MGERGGKWGVGGAAGSCHPCAIEEGEQLEVGDRSVGWVLHVRERRGKEGATCWALAQEEGGENARE